MDLSALFSSLETTSGTQLPRILGAVGILIVGWLVAVVVRAGVACAPWASPLRKEK